MIAFQKLQECTLAGILARPKWDNCYNIQSDSDDSTGWIDFSQHRGWSVVLDDLEMVLMFNSDDFIKTTCSSLEKAIPLH